MTRRVTHVALLALLGAGCLEGDPNPVTDRPTTGTVGGSSGEGPLPTVQPGGVCSQNSNEATRILFRNATASTTLNVLWVDYGCSEVLFARLEPGGTAIQDTFVTHPWRVRDASTGALYKEYVSPRTETAQVTVP